MIASFSALPPIPCHGSATLSFKPTSLGFLLKRQPKGGARPRRAFRFVRAAGDGDNGMKQEDEDNVTDNDSKNGGGDLKRERQRPGAFNLRWRYLLSPDPDNALAVALTGLLTWASVQVVFQLFFISVAILLAALNNINLINHPRALEDLIKTAYRFCNEQLQVNQLWLLSR